MRLATGGEGSRVSSCTANSFEEAKLFFRRRKQMDEKTFDKLFIIELDEDPPHMR